MDSIKLPLFTALAVLSVAACSRNRGGDDVATGSPTPADTVTRTDTVRAYPSPTDTVMAPTPRDTITTPHDTTGMPGGMAIDSTQLALGDSVYKGKIGGANCSSCHGEEGKGTDLGPDLTDSRWINGDGGRESIKNIVREGVPTPKEFTSAMPAYKDSLNEEQIDAVATFVQSLNGARVSTPTPSR